MRPTSTTPTISPSKSWASRFPRQSFASVADVAVYLFDTSGLVKRHVREAVTAWVRSLSHPKAGHTIFVARITGVEVFAAVARRQCVGSLTPAQAGAIFGHFRRHYGQRDNIVELTPALNADAMLLARKHGLRAYDAVQLASMREVD